MTTDLAHATPDEPAARRLTAGRDVSVGDALGGFLVGAFEPYPDADERLGFGPARIAVDLRTRRRMTVFDDWPVTA